MKKYFVGGYVRTEAEAARIREQIELNGGIPCDEYDVCRNYDAMCTEEDMRYLAEDMDWLLTDDMIVEAAQRFEDAVVESTRIHEERYEIRCDVLREVAKEYGITDGHTMLSID